MAEEAIQSGQAADGNGLILWVPTIADTTGPDEDELTAGTVKPLTYGLMRDGFNHQVTFGTITVDRYMLAQVLESEGVPTDTLELTYPYNRTTPTVAEQTLVKGASGFIVQRLGYPNGTAIAAGQKLNAVIPVKIGTPREVPAAQNQELRKIVKAYVTGIVRREVTVAAGA